MDHFNATLDKYLLEAVPVALTKKIRKSQTRKNHYKPGTFGVEIEVRVEEYRIPIDEDYIFEELKETVRHKMRYNDAINTTIKDEWKKSDIEDWEEFLDYYVERIMENGAVSEWGVEEEETGYDTESVVSDIIDSIEELGLEVQEGDAEPFDGIWGVGTDGDDIVEVRTPALTTKDFQILREVLNELAQYNTDGKTSAHVHIGMPENTDAFDLIAITTLADEKAIQADAGPSRAFGKFARFNELAHSNLIDVLRPGTYTNTQLMDSFYSLDRYHGTNVLSFKSYKTVEFRYLSSEILDDIDAFYKWIQYYLLLPQIAQSRKTITLKSPPGKTISLTRLPGGLTEVSNKRTKEHPYAPKELRNQEQPSPIKYKHLTKERLEDLKHLAILHKIHNKYQPPLEGAVVKMPGKPPFLTANVNGKRIGYLDIADGLIKLHDGDAGAAMNLRLHSLDSAKFWEVIDHWIMYLKGLKGR